MVLFNRGRSLSDRTGGKSTSEPQYQCLAWFFVTLTVLLRSSFISLNFFVLIPIGQKQLDPDAIWISAIFSFTFPPGVLAAYVAQFLLILKTLPIESHVQGLDNVTNISTLVALAPNLQEELLLLSGFLPSWLNLIFSHDFGWHSFTTELLDYLQLGSRSTFARANMGSYLKATHQKKDWWCPRLLMCLKGCTDKTVLKFAKKAWTNHLNKQDDYFYTGLYIGESLKFCMRMSRNHPLQFLSWFPATHTFMLAWLSQLIRLRVLAWKQLWPYC